jgi:hypothetical protein
MDELPIRWQVWRQDDNGARFLIASYDTERHEGASRPYGLRGSDRPPAGA